MTLVCNKWSFLVFTFLLCQSAAWSKSLAAGGFFTPTGQINPEIFSYIFAYSAVLVPLDFLLTALTMYYFGRRLRR